MADGGTTATDVRSRRWLPLVLKLSGLALVVAVTVAVTLLAVDRRRQADERDGVRWCQQQVIAQALRDQKATASAEIQFAGEQFVVGQNDAGRRAIEVDGAVVSTPAEL